MADRDRRPRPEPRVVRGLIALTLTAGMIDAVTFVALERVFAANVTGNLVVLGFAIAGEATLRIDGPLLALVAFLAGAAAFGRIDHGRETRNQMLRRMVRVEIIAVGVAVLVAIGFSADDDVRRLLVTALLAGAMGARNATIARVAISELPTTVMTLPIARFAADEAVGSSDRSSDRLRIAGVVAMLVGATLSALLVLNTAVAWALALILAVELGVLATLGRGSAR